MHLVQQRSVADSVKRRLRTSEDRDDLLAKIRVEQDGVTTLYRVIATDDDARGAQRLANVWVDTFARDRERELDTRLARGTSVLRSELTSPETPGTRKTALREQIERLELLRAATRPTVEVINEAELPDQPVSAGAFVTALTGLIVGLVLGTGIAVLLDQLSGRRREPGV
jgi:capsular polysaccharide biosynthesis protein